jgi:hypothetical protein
MLFCSAWQCAFCSLAEGSASCLRKQVRRCESYLPKISSRGLHDAVNELRAELIAQADALEKDRGALPAPTARVSA